MPAYDVETPPSTEELPVEDFGGTYELETEHVENAIGQLIDFFRAGPRNRALVRAFATQIQEIEDAVWALKGEEFIDTATDHRLDLIGLVVGEGRSGRSDADYRNAIRIRSLVDRSNGKLTEIVEVLALLLPLADISIYEGYPASMQVDIDELGLVDGELVGLILQQMKAGGVALDASAGYEAGFAVGAVDGDPLGGTIGSVDGDYEGFKIATVL